MPPKKKPKFSYSHDQLLLAVKLVQEDGVSVNSAAKRYGIPQSTLAYKVAGKTPLERKMGPQPVLGTQTEDMLSNWVQAMALRGFPVTTRDLLTSAKQINKDLNVVNNKKDLGRKWLALFLQRHPKIAERKPEKLSKVRALVTERSIRDWFTDVTNYINENNLKDAFLDPSRVFNMDESGFLLCPKTGKVLGVRGQKNVYEFHTGNDKESITVLCSVNAKGDQASPLVVFPGKRLPQATKLSFPEDWILSRSDSGWINGEVFYEYIANEFCDWVKRQKITFPIIIFLDGHKSHLTFHLSKFCSENNIVLIALPPNTTHITQPLDVSVFGPLKQEWANTVHEWRLRNSYENLTKYNFASLLKEVFDTTMKPESIVNGFRCCGLSPFNANAVDFSKCEVPKTIEQQKTTQHSRKSSPTHSKQECLDFLESFVNKDLLQEFKDTYNAFTPVWKGVEAAHDLYVVWRKAKDAVSKEIPTTVPIVEAPDNEQENTEDNENLEVIENIQVIPGCSSDKESRPLCASNDATQMEKVAKVLSPGTEGKGVPTPVKKYLIWPGTPPKKGKYTKKNKEKFDPVISGKKWQEREKAKRDEREELEREKAEKRRLREEKKSQKGAKKTTKKALVYDEEEDWTCFVCKKRYSAELIIGFRRRWIECDDCKSTFHYKCIPKKHRDFFGIEEDDDDDDELQFVCHMCSKENDSDNEPFILSEPESEID